MRAKATTRGGRLGPQRSIAAVPLIATVLPTAVDPSGCDPVTAALIRAQPCAVHQALHSMGPQMALTTVSLQREGTVGLRPIASTSLEPSRLEALRTSIERGSLPPLTLIDLSQNVLAVSAYAAIVGTHSTDPYALAV